MCIYTPIKKPLKVAGELGPSAPSISHMLFADDAYIFCQASVDSAECVLQILNSFEKVSGQQININKSSIFFSNNTCNPLKEELCHKLKFHEASAHSTYRGFPML